VDRTVSFTKGCYTGQELVARIDSRGSRVPRRLCGLVVADGEAPGTGAERLVGATLVVPGSDKPVGTVTSATWCPGVGAVGALAYLHRSVDLPGQVVVQTAGGLATPAAGGLTAEARPLPLVRRHTAGGRRGPATLGRPCPPTCRRSWPHTGRPPPPTGGTSTPSGGPPSTARRPRGSPPPSQRPPPATAPAAAAWR